VAYQNWLCFDNAGHAQRISDFSTAHRTRNTLAARLRFPFVWEKKHINYSLFFALFFVRKKRETTRKKEKKNKKIISRNMFSIKNQMQVIPLFVDCCHFCSFLFMSFHFFYFLFISFHFLHVSSLAKTITNQDPLHVDPLLSFVEVFSFLLR